MPKLHVKLKCTIDILHAKSLQEMHQLQQLVFSSLNKLKTKPYDKYTQWKTGTVENPLTQDKINIQKSTPQLHVLGCKQCAKRTWSPLDYSHSELVIMNETYFGESQSLPGLINVITQLTFSLVIFMRRPETQPNCVNATSINYMNFFSITQQLSRTLIFCHLLVTVCMFNQQHWSHHCRDN